MTHEPGITYDMSWDEYRAIPLPSPSLLKRGLRSMKHLKRAIDGDIPGPSEKVTAVGNAVHCMVAGEFDERCAELPAFEKDIENCTAGTKKTAPKTIYKADGSLSVAGEKWETLCLERDKPAGYDGDIYVGQIQTESKTTSYYQARLAEFQEANQGKIILSEGQLGAAHKCFLAIRNNQDARQIMGVSDHEATVIGYIEGVLCKTRMDFLNAGACTGGDLKTTNDVEEKAFYRKCKQLNYLFQFAFHYEILASLNVHLQSYDVIAAESEGDYDVAVYEIGHGDTMDCWRGDVRKVIREYRDCMESGKWPGMYEGPVILDVPMWDMPTEEAVFNG